MGEAVKVGALDAITWVVACCYLPPGPGAPVLTVYASPDGTRAGAQRVAAQRRSAWRRSPLGQAGQGTFRVHVVPLKEAPPGRLST